MTALPADRDRASILIVCTGNICRSPTVELIMRRVLAEAGERHITVSSSGVSGLTGHPIDPAMGTLLASDGINPTGFVARPLDADQVAAADLVLAATSQHRSQIVRLVPRALRKSFTLLEFARLAAAVAPRAVGEGPARLLSLADEAAAHRSLVLPWQDPLDIDDPHGRSGRTYRRAYQQLNETARTIARAVIGEPQTPVTL